MTAERSAVPVRDQIDPSQADKIRCVLTMIVTGGLLLLIFRNPWIPSAIRLLFAIALVLGLVRWSGAILLGLIQLDLALLDHDLPVPVGVFLDFATSVLTIALLMAVCRLRSAQELTGAMPVRKVLSLLVGGVADQNTDGYARDDSAALSVFTWLWVFTLVTSAGLLLVLLPADMAAVSEYGLTPTGMRCIQVGLVLVIGYTVLTVPLGELWWRRISADQAGVYLRSLYLSWSHADLRMVVRRQIRRRRKILRQQRAANVVKQARYRSFRYSPTNWRRKRPADVATQASQSVNVSSKEIA